METGGRVASATRGDGAGCAIECRRDADGTVRLILGGELDTVSRDVLRAALMAEERAGTAVVVVLDQLEYIDSAGIAELLRASEHAGRAGRRFAVTPGSANVARVLRISGALELLSVASGSGDGFVALSPRAAPDAGPDA